MDTFEILDEIARTKRLPFLVIGGHAVNAYGYSRFTNDLDILIQKDDRSVWQTAFETKGYKLHHDGGAFLQMIPLSGASTPLDLMLVNTETFAKLGNEAKSVEIQGFKMRVPSLENLFALKFHVLQQEIPHRGYKDLMDILSLADCNAVDLHSDKIRELCEKFGNKKIYERLIAFRG